MKKWLTLTVLGMGLGTAAVAAGLTSGAEQMADGPTDAEYEAHVDARLHEVMQGLLAAQRADARTAALGR
jgi:hypothetical protein